MSQEEEEALGEEIEEIDEPIMTEDMTISLNAIEGYSTINIIRMRAKAYGQEIYPLIVSGSTHCFLDEEICHRLNCNIENATPMMVTIADGSKVISRRICSEFTWEMQGHKFTCPMRIIKLGGCDMVLGGDWLKEHSPIEIDYNDVKISINNQGKRSSIKAITSEAEVKFILAQGM